MLTNGYAIYNNPSILVFLKERGIKIVEMSYHFGILDQISVMSNNMLEKIVEYLKEKDMQIKILVTINSTNCNMLAEMC